jgi:hypothetical protein
MKVYVILLATLLAINFVMAAQPMQQSNKIYLDPFYRQSMLLGTNYTYLIKVNPPDGISSVVSAIISFDIYMTPSVNFSLSVNGQKCNTPWFYVSTTFASAGQARVNFDCNNIINKSGTYTVVLRATQANTGSVSGWLDLTYMNNPAGTVEVSGTEYQVGDTATTFLQLKDDQGLPVNNGACYLDVYYPTSYNATHTKWLDNVPMIFKGGGMYYYDVVVPNYTGVYMTAATCYYAYNWVWIYPYNELVYYPVRAANSGIWGGAEANLNNPEDGVYDECTTSGSGTCQANYTFNISQYGSISNITNINLYYLGEDTSSKVLTVAYWNGTAFVNLANTLTFVATGSATVPSGIDQFLTNVIPLNGIINNQTVIIRLTVVHTGTATMYDNWLSLGVLNAKGTIQELKGSSEMHVSSQLTVIQLLLNDIWTYIQNIWNKLLGIEVTVNATYNNTNTIISRLNGTGKIAEVLNQSTLKFLSNIYYATDSGRLYVQALKGDLPANDLSCYLNAYYPNGSIYVGASMTSIGSNGLYYYNITPSVRGVYATSVNCTSGAFGGRTLYTAGSFEALVLPQDQISVIS